MDKFNIESEDGFPKPTCGDAATGLIVAKPIEKLIQRYFLDFEYFVNI